MKSESQAHTELGHGDAGAPGDAELTVTKSGGAGPEESLKGGACCAELRCGRSGIVSRKLGDTQPVEEKGPKGDATGPLLAGRTSNFLSEMTSGDNLAE